MNPERFRRIDALFERVLELPETQRLAYLDAACEGDPEMRQAVTELLAADDRAQDFLAHPISASGELAPGAAIGAYRIDRLLGRGGMGAVYLAHRDDVDRPVALKLVESPFRHPELVPRFHEERQILARLEHPAIARLYDAGTTEDGMPYLVLEYVDGEPLDTYCDRHRLGLTARLELFQQLLDAVAHAHQSLLVHRDIKPANVLVTEQGQVKLLDFGIAKRLSTPASSVSRTRARPMTPAYASPEQVRGEPVTTATDTYSLGVVLYELLTGTSPYRPTSALPHQLEAAILDQEPERPSAVLDREGATAMAAARSTSPTEWRRALRGDLDTIVLTALHKEPARRYRSVLELASDLDRWRNLLPITARPDTSGYRLRKFVRRRRGAVVAAGIGLLVGTGLVVSLFLQRDRATRERDRARDALRFVVDVFKQESPYQQGAEEVTAREILAAAARRATEEMGNDAELQASLYRALGQASSGIGRYDDALPLLERSLAYERASHPDSSELASSLEALGWLEFLRDQGESALAHLGEAVALRRRHDPDSLALAEAIHLWATVQIELLRTTDEQRTTAIEALFQEALELSRRIEGPTGPGTIANLGGLVKTARGRGDLARAEALARQALAASIGRFGPEHPEVASGLRLLGLVLLDEAKFDETELLFPKALAILEKALPPDHPEIVTAVSDLGLALSRAGRYGEAEPLFRRAYEATRAQRGENHRDTVLCLGHLATVLQGQERVEESIPLRERGLAAELKIYGEEAVIPAQTMGSLSRALADLGRFGRAKELGRRSLAIQTKILAADHPDLAWPHRSLGMVLLAAGEFPEAESHLRQSLEILRRTQEPTFFQTARVEVLLGSCLTRLGRFDEAATLIDHGRSVLEAQFSPDHERVKEAREKFDQLAAARRATTRGAHGARG